MFSRYLLRLFAIMLLTLSFQTISSTAPAHALSCAPPPPLEEQYKEADYIIVAQIVEKIEEKDSYEELLAEVKYSIKGDFPKTMSIYNYVAWEDNYNLDNDSLRVFQLIKEENGNFVLPICLGSEEWSPVTEKIMLDLNLPLTEPLEEDSQKQGNEAGQTRNYVKYLFIVGSIGLLGVAIGLTNWVRRRKTM